jgi:hypothetical protein
VLVTSVGVLCEPKSGREWEKRHTQTCRHKTEKWDRECYTFLVGNVSAYLSQGIYFIGQYKEKTQVKIKLQQFLDLR